MVPEPRWTTMYSSSGRSASSTTIVRRGYLLPDLLSVWNVRDPSPSTIPPSQDQKPSGTIGGLAGSRTLENTTRSPLLALWNFFAWVGDFPSSAFGTTGNDASGFSWGRAPKALLLEKELFPRSSCCSSPPMVVGTAAGGVGRQDQPGPLPEENTPETVFPPAAPIPPFGGAASATPLLPKPRPTSRTAAPAAATAAVGG